MPHVSSQNLITIEPNHHKLQYWNDLWRYRELFRVLAWRDISVRYKQTVVGAVWALVRPIVAMVVFTIVFGKLAQLPSEGAPYALLVFAGLLPWTLFSTALTDASNSLVSNANLIGKIYFPRLVVPAAAVVVSLADFLLSLLILVALMVWYQYHPGWQILLLPIFVAITFVASLGPALWIASLNVKYRDFHHLIPFIVQFGMYISPVGFSSSIVPGQWRLLYSINPMVGIIDGFRWSILRNEKLYMPGVGMAIAVATIFLWFGVHQFRKMEKDFADLI
jgi:lipopolysaccharide transport system permease protein